MLDKTRQIVRDILTTAAGDASPSAPLVSFSGLSGNGHTFNVHITAGPIPPCLQLDAGRQAGPEAQECSGTRATRRAARRVI